MRAAVLCALVALSACASPSMYRDPKTGQVQQCTTNVPPTLPALAQSDIDKCSKALEALGWQKVN